MKKISVQICELEEKQQRVAARLGGLRSRQARIEKAKETRRLVLAGKFMLKLCGNDMSRVAAQMQAAGFLDEAELAIFGLPKSQGSDREKVPGQ